MSQRFLVGAMSLCLATLVACSTTKTKTKPGAPEPPSPAEALLFDEAPRVVESVAPEYPREARRKEIQGEVLLRVEISATGDVSSAEVIESTDPIFEKPAKIAILQWRFEPATAAGRPVRSVISVPIKFSLQR